MTWTQKKKLSFRQKRAAKLLVAGCKITQIAKMLGVRRETIWAWKKQERFMKRVGKLQAEVNEHIQRLSLPYVALAFNALEKMLKSSDLNQKKFAIVKILQLNGRLPWEPERRRRT